MADEWGIPGYRLDRRVSAAGPREVWRATRLADGRAVAAKRLPGAAGRRAAGVPDLAALAELSDPHLPELLDVVVSDGDVVVVTAWAAGGSAADLLEHRNVLHPGEVVTMVAPLARLLDRLHRSDWVHGDVCPANILFTGDGRPLLADFSTGRRSFADGSRAGTPPYLDPVVARGAEPDPASDVFGLAGVAFASLTGRAPWTGATAEEAILAARTGRVPAVRRLAPGVPEALADVIDAALAVDPADRPAAAELARRVAGSARAVPVVLGPPHPDDLRRQATVALDRPAAAPPDTSSAAGPHAGSSSRAIRPAVAVTAALLVLAVAVATGVLWGRSRDPAASLPPVARVAAAAPSASASAVGPGGDPETDWQAVMTGLDRRRTLALRALDADRLRRVYVPASRDLMVDLRRLREFRREGLVPRRLRTRITSVELRWRRGDRARLGFVSHVSGYRLVPAAGGVPVATAAAIMGRPAVATLARSADGRWRIRRIRADVSPR